MSYCPSSLSFSTTHSDKRVQAASQTLGDTVVRRVLAFALFLMGARREDIAQHLGLPLGTLLSLLTRITRDGLPALEDRRHGHAQFLPAVQAPAAIHVAAKASGIVVDFGAQQQTVAIPAANVLQARVFLLTLLDNGVLDVSQVADLLGYSVSHTARLARQLAQGDVPALIDKRQGPQEDYRVTADIKAELIQQFAVDVIARGKTSGEAISRQLEARCHIRIPARTVRHHVARLGLPAIRRTLPELVDAVKKTSRDSS